ncbi:hypothetical protein HYW42_04070 [Candidatus Daviesbacteria bacterium]|nr:hypothetical protein [Candidatus Daviesbacteria bacterium]
MPEVVNPYYVRYSISAASVLYGVNGVSKFTVADIANWADFEDVEGFAERLGYEKSSCVLTQRGRWEVWSRFNHAVPNFPAGSTTVHSMVALYDGRFPAEHALARTNIENGPSFRPEQFIDDLKRLTRFYIERPDFPRLPISIAEIPLLHPLSAALLGGIVFAGISLLPPEFDRARTLYGLGGGYLLGILTPYAALGWNKLSEVAMKDGINHKEYSAGYQVPKLLQREEEHTLNVLAERDLFQALEGRDIILNPDEFLENVYRPLANSALLAPRLEEIREQRGKDPTETLANSPAREKLIKAAVALL